MSSVGVRPSGRSLVVSLLVVAVGVVAALAARADMHSFVSGPWGTVADVGVGLVFVVSGLAASGPDSQRALVASVGVAWLAGSLTPLAFAWHQGVLVAALVAFPSGRPAGARRWLLLAAGVLVAAQELPPWGVVLVFATVGLVAWGTSRSSAAAVYPVVGSLSTAAALAFVWLDASGDGGPVVYQGVLVAVAVGYPVAVRELARDRRRRVDAMLGDPPEGLAGLEVLLRQAVGDETLTVVPGRAERAWAVPGRATDQFAGRLLVSEGDEVLATVMAASGVLDDEPTAHAVVASVRLFLRNKRLREEQALRLAALRESRARLVAAADRERDRTSSRLAREVGEPLAKASRALAALAQDADLQWAEVLMVAMSELDEAADDIRRLVAGSPPVPLGNGRLGAVLEEMAGRWPGRIRVSHDGGAEAGPAAETALFYVCSEAVANCAKHATGAPVTIDLSRSGPSVVLTVRDEGPGGADPGGSGLLGLRDRMATVDGTLEVHSAAGGGTTIVAQAPVTASGRTPVHPEHQFPDALRPLA